MQLLIANVGINNSDAAKRKLKSPIFNDGTFEFIPIKESKAASEFCLLKYKDIKCYNNPNLSITQYFELPKVSDYYVHNDPEFQNFTYGDIDTSRSSNLKDANPGDKILFLARLYDYDVSRFCKSSGLYFIGLITILRNLYFDIKNNKIPDYSESEVKTNAHFIKYKNGNSENFRIIIGDKNLSYRFKKALKISPEIVELIYNGKHDSITDTFISNAEHPKRSRILNKNGNLTKYSNFHSNTRTIQIFLDTDGHETEASSFVKIMDIIHNKCLK